MGHGSLTWLAVSAGSVGARCSAGTVDHSTCRGAVSAVILLTGWWLVSKESPEREGPMGKYPERLRKKPLSF